MNMLVQAGPVILYGEGGVPAMVRYALSLLVDGDEGTNTDADTGD
jgi:hypothetical protein